ncbi:hypothetical protein BKH43_01690 [Helicobacter sp. 13S00401-1]|uniref:DCC1-like thiol-disulfide oxidoreductase family protein n=1 Tax=Helicobacter sp. 13S00401-1 TaxID=1905758 RepID=UPI000BA75181|nr:DCC1-like thiol-disulfide oxidoreductase family protein [Helicobacter sp. 13S00401-1]PAF51379.1 hypothetical protein BKH43_01690 [Helicobacter sp. 13S00401-1]
MTFVFYDAKCDICQNYKKYMDIKKRRELVFVDLRDKEEVARINPKILLLNPNLGMIVYIEDKDLLLQGSKALSNLHAKNRFHAFIIRAIYPFLKLVRRVLLRIKRVKDISFSSDIK